MTPFNAVLDRLRVRGTPAADGTARDSAAIDGTPAAPPADPALDALPAAVASLREQCEALQRELRETRDELQRVGLREAQLRAVLRRDVELEPLMADLDQLLARGPAIQQHVARAVQSAELALDPFPHAIVDGLLPDDLYRALLHGIPPVELFGDKPPNKQQLLVPFALGPAYARKAWQFFSMVVNAAYVTPEVMRKFEAPLTDWVRRHWPDEDPASFDWHCANGRVMRRVRGYRIEPHRDPKWGFITCLLYLARPEDDERWGTQFYAVDGDEEARGAKPHWIEEERCRLVRDVTFRPNRMLVFLNSVGAHGAFIPKDAEPADLDRYTYQFRIGPGAPTIARLQAQLTEEQRQLWAGKVKDY